MLLTEKESRNLCINLKLMVLQRQLKEVSKLIVEKNDKMYVDELIAISDVSLRLENLRLYKLIKKGREI